MSRLLSVFLTCWVTAVLPCMAQSTAGGPANDPGHPPASSESTAFADIIRASEYREGFLPMYWHAASGTLYAQIDQLQQPFIYYTSLSQGVGSNDLGLDRGRLGDTYLAQFERVGPKVLLMALNTRFRAHSDNTAERRAVDEAFARSVLWGFEVAGQ